MHIYIIYICYVDIYYLHQSSLLWMSFWAPHPLQCTGVVIIYPLLICIVLQAVGCTSLGPELVEMTLSFPAHRDMTVQNRKFHFLEFTLDRLDQHIHR